MSCQAGLVPGRIVGPHFLTSAHAEVLAALDQALTTIEQVAEPETSSAGPENRKVNVHPGGRVRRMARGPLSFPAKIPEDRPS